MLEQQRLIALQRFQQQQTEIQMRKQMAQANYMMAGQMPQMPGQRRLLLDLYGLQYNAVTTVLLTVSI